MRIFWRISTVGYMAALAYVSLQPGGDEVSPSVQFLHNLAHAPAYAILTCLLVFSFIHLNFRTYLFSATIALGFGILLEFGQAFVPNRFPSLSDVLVNSAGITAALCWLHCINRKKKA